MAFWLWAILAVGAVNWLVMQVSFDICKLGNVTVLQLVMLTAAMYLLGCGGDAGAAAGGAVLAAAVMFKPNVGLAAAMVAVGLAIDGRYRKLAFGGLGAGLGGGAAFAAGACISGTLTHGRIFWKA